MALIIVIGILTGVGLLFFIVIQSMKNTERIPNKCSKCGSTRLELISFDSYGLSDNSTEIATYECLDCGHKLQELER